MPGPVSYEPSLLALLADILPSATVLSGGSGLRRRVSWTLLARATGLGEVEGGELALVPEARVAEVMPRLGALAAAGVAGVVLAGNYTTAGDCIAGVDDFPVIALRAGTDLLAVRRNIERYLTRRRRELFALHQELHRLLVEPALAGASIESLLGIAATRARAPMAVDTGSELRTHRVSEEDVREVVREARGAGRKAELVELGSPAGLAMPVVVGGERRGLALLLSAGAASDDEEAILAALVSALTIVLSRVPHHALPTVPEILLGLVTEPDMPWTALAVSDAVSGPGEVERALAGEFSARGMSAELGTGGDAVIALVSAADENLWPALVRAVCVRLGSRSLRGSVGRTRMGAKGAEQSAAEAELALSRTEHDGFTAFEEVELLALWDSHPGWQEFARHRLGPLLRGTQGDNELLQTLSTYLLNGRNAKSAAAQIGIHRNTMIYRLRRIEEKLSVDLDDQETVFALEIAVRIFNSVRY